MQACFMITGVVGRVNDTFYKGKKPSIEIRIPINDYSGRDEDGNPKFNTTWHHLTAWTRIAELIDKNIFMGSVIRATCRVKKVEDKFYFDIVSIDFISNYGPAKKVLWERMNAAKDAGEDEE